MSVRSAPFRRRGIPVLIIGFLVLVALIRFGALAEHHSTVESDVDRDLKMGARYIAAESHALSSDEAEASPLDILVTSRLPADLMVPGRFVVISGTDGAIKATSVGYEYLIGSDLVSTLGLSPSAIQFGRGDAVIAGIFDEEPVSTASMSLAADLGLATIVQIDSAAMTGWRKSLAINVSLFTFTSLVLLALILAFYQQAARAAEIEADYQEQRDLVDTAFVLGHSGIWDWNVTGGQLQLSGSVHTLLGLKADGSRIGLSEFRDRLHPSDRSVMNKLHRILAGEGSSFDQTFRLRHHNGHYLWFRARAEATVKADGERHLVGVVADVSEQQELSERTRQAHQQLHNAIENIPETFVLCDNDDKIVLANSNYRAVFGLSEADTKPGTHLAEVMTRSRRPIESHPLTGRTSNGADSAYEIKMADGRWLLLSERRTQEGFIAIGADITKLKMHQARLHESERRLTDAIHTLSETQRDAELKAEQLEELNLSFRREKNRAEAASCAKTKFLANMSHELRTPLNAILGFSDIMRQGILGPIGCEKYAGYANDIYESGSFLLQLIDDILDMQKIESGRTTILRQVFNLSEAVDESARMVEATAGKHNVTVAIEQPETLNVYADRRALIQIMTNLVSNAVKFSEDGGTVRICVRERGGAIHLSVTDRGEGIAREHLKTIGKPFEQTESEWTRTKKGTGLGLAIARSLTELQGGRLKIASTFGEGTIVAVRLPNKPVRRAFAA
ncbi:PAS domain-containing sensor histidine kinase [Fulvimarina endophytica]|nr:PAS domain-containing sensor histidine kinase [Fulvimarina endophytica]